MEAAVSNHHAVALSVPSQSLEVQDWPAHAGFALHLVPSHVTESAPLQFIDVRPREESETATRVVNVIVAFIGLVVVSPLMIVVALLVRLTSRGPVLYS
ncbi:MAG: sugar transferase, partial [Gemmatimonadota bacterium]|nr:sugar transferase [Gemmatimonadota bacterium]